MTEDLVQYVRSAFALDKTVAATVSAGARGALGQIWRLDVGPAQFALKEIFPDGVPVSLALIEAEVEFTRLAAAAGVRLPASHSDRHGRYLLPMPSGAGWLRLYDWVDMRLVDLPVKGVHVPERLGVLLARLHRCAAPTAHEPGGGGPAAWYDHCPEGRSWPPVVAAAMASGAGWADLLADRVATLPDLSALVTSADPAVTITCHRDLHPENVLADSDGELVVVDWDNLGPAEPGRELACLLFHWFSDGTHCDIDAMRTLYQSYVREGGPGRIQELADFSMLIASRLNFLHKQVNIANDPDTEQRHRDWALREIDEALQILPTRQQLTEALTMTRRSVRR
jgi:Ser/Thr protein kinase RdoA (MazF antagonist)